MQKKKSKFEMDIFSFCLKKVQTGFPPSGVQNSENN